MAVTYDYIVLIADDDEDDCLLVKSAFEENDLTNELRFVSDGVELLEYLRREGEYTDSSLAPPPDLILLDLNMPRKDGRDALREIKADKSLCGIPVIVFTTSLEEEDVRLSYEIGASAFIPKPTSFEGLTQVIETLGLFWFDIVQLPHKRKAWQTISGQ
ncbi:MAG: response regulator [Syntrophobacteraceae bacterium]